MVTRVAIAALGLAACFGGGPTPGLPAGVDIIYQTPPPAGACSATYIADISLAGDNGIAATAPYTPWNSNCQGTATGPVQVVSFPKTGGDGAMLAVTGNGNTIATPRVAASGAAAAWAYWDSANGNLDLGPSNTMIPPGNGGGPQPQPGGLVIDTSASPAIAYVAGWNPPTNVVVTNPTFPCCGGNMGQPTPVYSFHSLSLMAGASATALAVTPRFWCESVRECLVASPADLVYVQHADPAHVATIDRFPKTGTTTADQVNVAALDGAPPAGLAADADHVAWSQSLDFTQLSTIDGPTTLPAPTCAIGAAATGAPAMMLLQTTQFSCTDVAVDATSVYFLIVTLDYTDHGVVVHTLGIGRIAFADGTFESVALGLDGFGAGPRGITTDGDSLFLIDPLLVARAAKSALDGKHDFTP